MSHGNSASKHPVELKDPWGAPATENRFFCRSSVLSGKRMSEMRAGKLPPPCSVWYAHLYIAERDIRQRSHRKVTGSLKLATHCHRTTPNTAHRCHATPPTLPHTAKRSESHQTKAVTSRGPKRLEISADKLGTRIGRGRRRSQDGVCRGPGEVLHHVQFHGLFVKQPHLRCLVHADSVLAQPREEPTPCSSHISSQAPGAAAAPNNFTASSAEATTHLRNILMLPLCSHHRAVI